MGNTHLLSTRFGRERERAVKYRSSSPPLSVDACLFHNIKELLFVYFAVAVLVELVDHCLQLVVAEVLSELSGHSAKISQAYSASIVLVK